MWPDLPPELLREISGHLHAAVDFVHFHAVCRPWRDTLDPQAAAHQPPRFLPWLVAPSDADGEAAGDLAGQRCRCVFSGTSSRSPGICFRDRRVACADGTAAWVVSNRQNSKLVNPLTAARLPISIGHLNEWEDRHDRIVSGDGTFLIYDFVPYPEGTVHPYSIRFRGSTLCPDDEDWDYLSKLFSIGYRCYAVAYHDGATVCVDLADCHILRPDVENSYEEGTHGTQVALPDEPGKVRQCSYLLEFRGKLMLASVLLQEPCTGRLATDLSVSLHALVKEAEGDDDEEPLKQVSWEWDDATSLIGDHVLFLGYPGSFAVEAARFRGAVSGGSAYFVVASAGDGCSSSVGAPPEPCRVYRYSFQDGATTLVETLPPGWHDARCMWFLPQPGVAPISAPAKPDPDQQEAPATCSSARRPRRQQLTIYAGDLPPKVDNSRLREMFSNHGKVASARVAYDRSGRSRGFGFVTMATQEGFDNAMDALNAVEEPQHAMTRFGSVIRPFNLFVTLLILLLIVSFTFRA
ncbi:hypothetical protein ACP70R_038658 [Stipagrostis hirtigluma subsp. patula]